MEYKQSSLLHQLQTHAHQWILLARSLGSEEEEQEHRPPETELVLGIRRVARSTRLRVLSTSPKARRYIVTEAAAPSQGP